MNNAYEILGLQAGAERSEVKRSYQRLKEIYSHDSLAIYTLVNESERKERLELIESAYLTILTLPRKSNDDEAGNCEISTSGPMPDPETSTGAYLRWAREQAGLSIRQLADRTKISSAKLEDIEAERVDHLPPPVYLRGFVYEFARSLGLAEAFQLSEFYLRRISPSPGE